MKIRQHLEGLAKACPVPPGGDMNFHHFVLAEGKDFQPCKNPAHWITKRGKIGNCYKNAFMLVLEHPEDRPDLSVRNPLARQ